MGQSLLLGDHVTPCGIVSWAPSLEGATVPATCSLHRAGARPPLVQDLGPLVVKQGLGNGGSLLSHSSGS